MCGFPLLFLPPPPLFPPRVSRWIGSLATTLFPLFPICRIFPSGLRDPTVPHRFPPFRRRSFLRCARTRPPRSFALRSLLAAKPLLFRRPAFSKIARGNSTVCPFLFFPPGIAVFSSDPLLVACRPFFSKKAGSRDVIGLAFPPSPSGAMLSFSACPPPDRKVPNPALEGSRVGPFVTDFPTQKDFHERGEPSPRFSPVR